MTWQGLVSSGEGKRVGLGDHRNDEALIVQELGRLQETEKRGLT